jgi:hypothetical protein
MNLPEKSKKGSRPTKAEAERALEYGPFTSGEPLDWWGSEVWPKEALYGAALMRKGICDYQSWSEWMVLKYGESIRENLSSIYSEAESQATAVHAMEQRSRESLGSSVWKPLEDAAWSSEALREDVMLLLRIAYHDFDTWHPKRLESAVETVSILTVRRILAEIEWLPEEFREECRDAVTQHQAFEAANKAASAWFSVRKESALPTESGWDLEDALKQIAWAAAGAGWGAMRAAGTLKEFASAAAKLADAASGSGADPDDVLRKACQIWILAADWAEGPVKKTDAR